MKRLFITDPHLGVKRTQHTTQASRKRLQQHIYEKTVSVIEEAKAQGYRVYILGDLFDLENNPEEIVAQGIHVAQLADRVEGGNHDQKNDVSAYCSLHLVREALRVHDDDPKIVMNPNPSEPYCFSEVSPCDKTVLTFVPHCLTQDLFIESLHQAVLSNQTEAPGDGWNRVLCLHCNVGNGFGHVEGQGSALWLTDELRDEMEEMFDHIIVGHDHHPRQDGKLTILGNVYPISFGEIENRYSWILDSMTHEITKHELLFEVEYGYHILNVEHLLEMVDADDLSLGAQLVEITGEIKAHDYPALARAIQKLWKANEDTLFAVKNSVVVDKPGAAERDKSKAFAPKSLPELVRDAISETPFKTEYETLVSEVEE